MSGPLRVGTFLLLAVVGSACGNTGSSGRVDADDPESVLAAGQVADNDCERAMVTHAEYVLTSGLEGSSASEEAMFDTCTMAEFTAGNEKMSDRHRYPGHGRGYVNQNCRRAQSAYKGSRLCERS